MAVPAESIFSHCYLGFYDSPGLGGTRKISNFGRIILQENCSSAFPGRKHCVHFLGSGKSKASTSHVVAVTGVGTFLFSKPDGFLAIGEARLQPTDILGSPNSPALPLPSPPPPISPLKKELLPSGCLSLILKLSAELYWQGVLSPAET